MFWWRDWSSGNDFGADVFSGFCIPFFRRSFRYPCSKFSFFCCSAFDFSMFLNVFSNYVKVMFWWRDWSSWNDFGSDVVMLWGFFLFCLSVVDFSMFLSVFFNIVNVIIKWRGWSSWNDFGSDLFDAFCLPFYSKKRSFSVCEVFGVLLFGRCFFRFSSKSFLQQCQRDV